MQLKSFDSYGDLVTIERRVNKWLQAEPRIILSVQANAFRLLIRWRQGARHREPLHLTILPIVGNDKIEAQAKEFRIRNPNAEIVFEICTESFLFWFWADED